MISCSLANVMTEPANDTAPTSTVNAIASAHPRVIRLVELEQRDQRGRAAADAVEQRDELRHLRHLHVARDRAAIGRADGDGGEDPQDVVELRREEHGDDARSARRARR